jgi:aspartyl/glutamyl-tRNA(Asn/Gln) amidotransferase C subunit
MTVDRDLVLALEAQAYLRLEPDEREAMQASLQEMIDRFDRLAALDTAGVEPLTQVFPLANVTREDEVAPSMDNELLTENAPWSKDGAFLVYKAVE